MLKKIAATPLLLSAALLLTACGTPTEEDFMKDPELTQKTLEKCKNLDLTDPDNKELCANAATANVKMLSKNLQDNLQKLMSGAAEK